MTIRYVSSSATNGYGVGVASGSGLTPATAWTLTYAIATATAGDTLYFNPGDYRHATAGFVMGTSMTLVKDPALTAAGVPGAIRLLAANSAQIPMIINNTAGKVYSIGTPDTVGEFIADGEGVCARAFQTTSTAGAYNLNLYGFTAKGATTIQYYHRSQDCTLYAQNLVLDGPGATGGMYADAIASGAIIIDGVSYNITASTANGSGAIFLYSPSGSTGSVAILNPSGTFTSSGTSSACIQTRNLATLVRGNKQGSNVVSGTGSNNGIVWYRPSSIAVDGEMIIAGVLGRNDQSATGYTLLIGEDSNAVQSNAMANAAIITDCDVAGLGGVLTTHGPMIGWQKGASVSHNIVRRCLLIGSKGQRSGDWSYYYCNTFIDPNPIAGGGCLKAKGSNNCIFALNDIIMLAGRQTVGNIVTAGDDAVVSSGIKFIANNIFCPDVATAVVAIGSATDASTAKLWGNNYWTPAGVSGNPYVYQANNYATLALWKAAQEPSAESLVPVARSPTFWSDSYLEFAKKTMQKYLPWIVRAINW